MKNKLFILPVMLVLVLGFSFVSTANAVVIFTDSEESYYHGGTVTLEVTVYGPPINDFDYEGSYDYSPIYHFNDWECYETSIIIVAHLVVYEDMGFLFKPYRHNRIIYYKSSGNFVCDTWTTWGHA